MARRRSINRRWSRKSLNVTELDQDSEIVDTNNPLWWKNIESDITMRPSMQSSLAETTGSILDADSQIDPLELKDEWWNNLDRTKLSSSRRFSTRQSINQSGAVLESFISEGDDDVSIKKRKVLLRPRTNQSRGHDNFSKILNESDGAAQSEPVPGIRKSKSPARSDTELLRKKTRHRRSYMAGNSEDNVDDASFTSNDTDVVVKPRPTLFKKRLSGKHYSGGSVDVTQNDEAGPSGLNTSKNSSHHDVSRVNKSYETPKAIDSNESVLMGPPKDTSHRKRLSTISRKLNLTSEDSENDAVPKRRKLGFAKKVQERASINPFDEILSGHLEEENSATKTPEKNPHIREDDPKVEDSVGANDDDTHDPTSTMETVPMGDMASIPQQYSTIDQDTTSVEHVGDHRSISVTKEIPRFTMKRPNSILGENSRSQLIQDWKSSDGEDDSLVEKSGKPIGKVSKDNSTIKKSIGISVERVSSVTTLYSQHIEESDEQSIDEDQIVEKTNRSMKSTSHSRIIAESAYELPDKERSDSPIISMSENENDKSVDKSTREKRSMRQLTNKSINHTEVNESRQISARMNASPQKIDSDESISEEETPSLAIATRRSAKGDSHVNDGASTSRQSTAHANTSRRHAQLDNIISENDVEEEAKNNSESTILLVKKKSNTARKSISYRNKSGQLYLSEESTANLTKESEKSTSKSPRRSVSVKGNLTQQVVDSGESISEEESYQAKKSKSKSMKENSSRQLIEPDESVSEEEPYSPGRSRLKSTERILRVEGRNSNTARNSSVRADVSSGQDIESDDARDAANSKVTNLSTKRKASLARNSSANVSAQFEKSESADEEDELDEEKKNEKSVTLPPKKKISTARKSIARENVSTQGIDSDASSDQEDLTKRKSKSRSLPAKKKMSTSRKSSARANVSGSHVQSEDQVEHVANKSNIKLAEPESKKKMSIARKSITHRNISTRNIDSDVSTDENDSEKEISKSVNLSIQGKLKRSSKSTGRSNVSWQHKQSEDETAQGEDETNTRSGNIPSNRKISTARKSNVPEKVSEKRIESDENENEVETAEKTNSITAKGAKKSLPSRLSKNKSIAQNTTNRNKSILSTAQTFEEESSTVPADTITFAAEPSKLQNNPTNNNTSVLSKANVSQAQKNITDFFQSKFLQKSDSSKALDITSFDDEKLNLIREKMEKIKQQQMEAMNMNVTAKKKESPRPENALKGKHFRSKENVPKTTTKPAKVIDKAFIVNGTVYKRPKLPRPKPWVTDRLYRYLWKKMEPKFDLATRVKSEKFIVELSEVVAVTLRRKKYDSYKLEIDALMKKMAILGIIKTRNDFYDFCYDFMPYDFRVKATPILMPGNVRNIPYDPEKLHIPILSDDPRTG